MRKAALGLIGLVASLALAGILALLWERGVSSAEGAHPELRSMVGSRDDFLVALAEINRIADVTRRMEPKAVYRYATCVERTDEEGSYLEGVIGVPLGLDGGFISVGDFPNAPRLAKAALGDRPRDCPVRSETDLAEALQDVPILRFIDREVFPFARYFEKGARLELRRIGGYGEGFCVLATGVPLEVLGGIRDALDVLREANGLAKPKRHAEMEWEN